MDAVFNIFHSVTQDSCFLFDANFLTHELIHINSLLGFHVLFLNISSLPTNKKLLIVFIFTILLYVALLHQNVLSFMLSRKKNLKVLMVLERRLIRWVDTS